MRKLVVVVVIVFEVWFNIDGVCYVMCCYNFNRLFFWSLLGFFIDDWVWDGGFCEMVNSYLLCDFEN